ncbi:hypothetical protein COJ96_06825 [Bacillus sp. AFS073361]|uniref:hypothetical protein n=1 Tax=Bacillus sp. AFS073361 TaxID=2033511 RepID=UPI000BF3D923|nr:hypothetical protein [Bacillus sp. AFS073361]PFP30127.1 hypothetical protein COJ96_06825 [Bacillus sp. AFS073361]
MTSIHKKVIADAELKVKMAEIKESYGKAPGEDTTVDELQMRFDTLSTTLEDMLVGYVKYVGERPSRMRTIDKAGKMAPYANVEDEKVRKAPLTTQEGIGNLLDMNAEYLIRAQKRNEIKTRPAAEWRKLEREHVNKSDYTITDLYSDFKEIIEFNALRYLALLKTFGMDALECYEEVIVTWADYREERKKWKRCKHRFCLCVFPIDADNFQGKKKRKRDAKYCCRTCNENEKYSRDCYDRTKKILDNPTYLPDWFYGEVTEDWKRKLNVRNEFPMESKDIERQINKANPIYFPKKVKSEPVIGECVTRKLADLTSEQLESEKWKKAKNIRKIAQESGDGLPLFIGR